MRIMWLMPECPYPANTGGRVVMWNRLCGLSVHNDIYLYVVYDDESEKSSFKEISKFCRKVSYYSRNKSIKTFIKSAKYPFPAVSRWNELLISDFQSDYSEIQPELIIVEFPQMFGVLNKNIIRKTPIVLELHNIEFQSMSSMSSGMKGIKKQVYRFVSKEMERYERNIYTNPNVKLYTFVSGKDEKYFREAYRRKNTYLSPIGSQVKTAKIIENCHNIVFVAKMSYPPNEEGAIWLIEQILPKILKSVPDAKLYLVGKDPQEKLIELAESNTHVEVTGTVDDLDPYYNNCNLVVVPIMTGGGVNVKLLEALGNDKYVVTTSKGIEGTDFEGNVDVRVADDAEHFAKYCIDILNDPNSYDNLQMKNHAHRIMINKYSWNGIMEQFEKAISTLK